MDAIQEAIEKADRLYRSAPARAFEEPSEAGEPLAGAIAFDEDAERYIQRKLDHLMALFASPQPLEPGE